MSFHNSADQKTDVLFSWLKRVLKALAVVFILCLVFFFYFLTVKKVTGHPPADSAQFGEMFGGLSALLGGCALIAASLAYQLQHKEHERQVQATKDQKEQNDRQIQLAAHTARLQYLTHLHKFNDERIQSSHTTAYWRHQHFTYAKKNWDQLSKVQEDLARYLGQSTNGRAREEQAEDEQAEMRLYHGLTVDYTTPEVFRSRAGPRGAPACVAIGSYFEKAFSDNGEIVTMIWICSPDVDHNGIKWLEELSKKHCGDSRPALYLLTKQVTSSDPKVLTALCDWEASFNSPVFVRTNTGPKEFVNANLGLFVRKPESPDHRGILAPPDATYLVSTAWLGSCNLTELGLGLKRSKTSEECTVVVTAHDQHGINSIRASFLWFWRRGYNPATNRNFDYETKTIDHQSGKLVSVSGTAEQNLRKPADAQ